MFIPRWRLTISSSRSSGPGGQNVNKTESKIELRFTVDDADWIPPRIRDRLRRQCANRITDDGDFVLTCQEQRSRAQNLEEAIRKLSELLDVASVEPKTRRATKPTRSSQRKRVEGKKIRGSVKKARSWRDND